MKASVVEFNKERKIFWTLIAVVVALVSLYIYFVNQTVLNIVERSTMERQMTALNGQIGNLEFKSRELSFNTNR